MHSKHVLYMYVCVCMCKMNNIKQKHHWPHFKDIERERERVIHFVTLILLHLFVRCGDWKLFGFIMCLSPSNQASLSSLHMARGERERVKLKDNKKQRGGR